MKYRGGCAAPQLLRLNGCRWPEEESLRAFRGPFSPDLTFLSPVPATGFNIPATRIRSYTNVYTIDCERAYPHRYTHTHTYKYTFVTHGRLINLSCIHPIEDNLFRWAADLKTWLSWFPGNMRANNPTTFHLKKIVMSTSNERQKNWVYLRLWFPVINELF